MRTNLILKHIIMTKYIISTFDGTVTPAHAKSPLGLQISSTGSIYGFVWEFVDYITAVDQLNIIETKWRQWISDYNLWVGLDPVAQAKMIVKRN